MSTQVREKQRFRKYAQQWWESAAADDVMGECDGREGAMEVVEAFLMCLEDAEEGRSVVERRLSLERKAIKSQSFLMDKRVESFAVPEPEAWLWWFCASDGLIH